MRRQILGKIYETDDTPFKNGVIVFSRSIGSYTSTTQYPPDVHVCRTDTSGNLVDCFLWCNEDGDLISNYTAKINGRDVFNLSVPIGDGSPIELSALRAGSLPTTEYPESIIDYVDNKIESLTLGQIKTLFSPDLIAINVLSALRIIDINTTTYADSNNINHASKTLGFVANAVNQGAIFQAVTEGFVLDSNWDWNTNRPIFLGNNGFLTQSIPNDAVFVQQIAKTINTQKIFIDFQEVILL